MLSSLSLIFLMGLALAAICQQLHLPRIIGMLFTGILLGPYVLNCLDGSVLGISSELRQIALIIILIKAVLITAPLGALGMDLTYQKCLKREGNI